MNNERIFADEIYKTPVYEVYNCPASENGREGDLLHIHGTFTHSQTVSPGGCLFVTDEQGHNWLITHVLPLNIADGATVDVYGQYMGYSSVAGVPALTVIAQGAIRLSDGTVICDFFAVNGNVYFSAEPDPNINEH